jgi:hypothetical protein
MRLREVPMLVVLLLCASCSQPAPASAPKADLAAEEKAVRDADANWLKYAQARDARGEASMFASDGVAYREHVDPLVGPAAFEAWDAKQYAENPKQNGRHPDRAVGRPRRPDRPISNHWHRTQGRRRRPRTLCHSLEKGRQSVESGPRHWLHNNAGT